MWDRHLCLETCMVNAPLAVAISLPFFHRSFSVSFYTLSLQTPPSELQSLVLSKSMLEILKTSAQRRCKKARETAAFASRQQPAQERTAGTQRTQQEETEAAHGLLCLPAFCSRLVVRVCVCVLSSISARLRRRCS